MKTELGEAAARQALWDCLEEIPFLQLREVSEDVNISGPDFRLDIRINNRALKLVAEYKSSGQPRLAREASLQIKNWVENGLGIYGVFLAPYISPASAEICQKAGVGYMDLAGNCLLSFENVFIKREGKPNSDIQKRELRSLYSPKAERILRVLLSKPKENWRTETMAEAARVSYGQVSNVKKLLIDRDWIRPQENGLQLSNPKELLDEWAGQYQFQRNKVLDFYAMNEVNEAEYLLAEACRQQDRQYALTAFSGAARIAPVVRYQRVAAYVEGDIDELTNSLGWKLVSSGANINLLTPYDEGVFFDARDTKGVVLATPVQIYLDLQAQHGRGEEAAQAIRKVIEQAW